MRGIVANPKLLGLLQCRGKANLPRILDRQFIATGIGGASM